MKTRMAVAVLAAGLLSCTGHVADPEFRSVGPGGEELFDFSAAPVN